MCRHFAYLGDRVPIKAILLDPPHSLAEQAWRPRMQRHGTMNVEGFGIGWYADGDPVPARYRQAGPVWADESLPDLARVTRTRAMLCAVRSATAGTTPGVSAAAPYTEGSWLFSHNGVLTGWSAAAGDPPAGTSPEAAAGSAAAGSAAADAVLRLAASLSRAELLGLAARCDSALIWALVLSRLRAGEGAADALAGTVGDIVSAGGTGRFNLLLTDGEVIAATAAGDSLWYCQRPGGVIVASEPSDDDPDWQEVPDASVIEATATGAAVKPLLLTSP
jgi:gamma-glutamyl hercynylcysteine S-oxide hydrolase